MNEDLKNYIKQSRVAGQTDEQTKQALKSRGWQEVDINQALGGQSPVSEMASVATKSWLTGRIIAIVIALLVIAGGVGAYFMFSDVGSTQNISVIKTSFRCKDLLPDSDFERITGKKASDYQIVSYPFVVDDPSAVLQYYCNYVTNKKYIENVERNKSSTIKVSDINLSIFVGGHEINFDSNNAMDAISFSQGYDYGFNTIYYKDKSKSVSDWYSSNYDYERNRSGGQGEDVQIDTTVNGNKNSATFQSGKNGSVDISANGKQVQLISKTTTSDIPGIGTSAFSGVSEMGGNYSELPSIKSLYVLSSNKKFIIQLTNVNSFSGSYDPITDKSTQSWIEVQDLQIMKEIAKIIDANLNKY